MAKYSIDISAMTNFLLGLLNIYSPTGDTERAITCVRKTFEPLGLEVRLNAKGALIATTASKCPARPKSWLRRSICNPSATLNSPGARGR